MEELLTSASSHAAMAEHNGNGSAKDLQIS